MKTNFAPKRPEEGDNDLKHLLEAMAAREPAAFAAFAERFTPIIYQRCVFFGVDPPETWTEYCVMEISSMVPHSRHTIDPDRFEMWVLEQSWRILASRNEETHFATGLVRAVMRLHSSVDKVLLGLTTLQQDILLLEGQERIWEYAVMAEQFGVSEESLRQERARARSRLLLALRKQPDLGRALDRLVPMSSRKANGASISPSPARSPQPAPAGTGNTAASVQVA